MRTTLTLDDDLAGLLKEQARKLGISFKEEVNSVLRSGLGGSKQARPRRPPRTKSYSFGFLPGVDLDRLNQLSDDLEADAMSRALMRKRP